jgi:hypothetical protein
MKDNFTLENLNNFTDNYMLMFSRMIPISGS